MKMYVGQPRRPLTRSATDLLTQWYLARGMLAHAQPSQLTRIMIVSADCPWFELYVATGIDKISSYEACAQAPPMLMPHLVIGEACNGTEWVVELELAAPYRLIFKDNGKLASVTPFDDANSTLIKSWTRRYDLPPAKPPPKLPPGIIRLSLARWLLLDWAPIEQATVSSGHHVKVLTNSVGFSSLATNVKSLDPKTLDRATTQLVKRMVSDIDLVRAQVDQHLVADVLAVEMEEAT